MSNDARWLPEGVHMLSFPFIAVEFMAPHSILENIRKNPCDYAAKSSHADGPSDQLHWIISSDSTDAMLVWSTPNGAPTERVLPPYARHFIDTY